MNIEQKELFLVPFPFSDLSGQKVRPVLILSKNEYNTISEDVIVCSITSNLQKETYKIAITTNDLEEGKLFETSCIKIENVLKIHKKLLIKKIGKLKQKTFSHVLERFFTLFK